MKVNQETVKRVAELSSLDFEQDEQAHMAEELTGLLNWVEQLDEVNIEGLDPMMSAIDITAPLREDKIRQDNHAEEIVKNAPQTEENYFIVPQVIE